MFRSPQREGEDKEEEEGEEEEEEKREKILFTFLTPLRVREVVKSKHLGKRTH